MQKIELNMRVRIKATGQTGAITKILNGRLTDIARMPKNSPDAFPYYYQVQIDNTDTRRLLLTKKALEVIEHAE